MSNIIILDTGAEYILSLDNIHVETAIRLYESMEVTPYKKVLGASATADEMKFVYENVGRVVPCAFANSIDIPKKLEEDVAMALRFYKCKAFWKNMSGVFETPADAQQGVAGSLKPLQAADLLPAGASMYNEELYGSSILHAAPQSSALCVLYNTIYALCLVTHLDSPESFCEAFQEFVVVMKAPGHTDSESVKKHFDKVSYPTLEDARSTCEAFKRLYGIGTTNTASEKDRVKRFLDSHFDVSNDQEKRMKANDLYKELINHLCVPYEQSTAFKKRVAGCLTEMGLQKKRFSDAYYYYGISKKEYPSIDLKIVEDQRDKQRKAWFYAETRVEGLRV